MNKCVFTGRLSKDPAYKEGRGVGEQASFLAFSLAVTTGYGDKADTMWVDCSASGEFADTLHKTLYKGVKVLVEGKLYTYTSKFGNDKIALTLSECEVVQHTKAYLAAHPAVVNETKKETETEYKSTKYKSNFRGTEGFDYDDRRNNRNKFGLEEDEDGFMTFEDEDDTLPFD